MNGPSFLDPRFSVQPPSDSQNKLIPKEDQTVFLEVSATGKTGGLKNC